MDSTKKSDLSSSRRGSINELAQDRFEAIKSRMKLNMFQDAVVSENYPQRNTDFDRIQELMNHPEQNDKFQVKDEKVQEKIEQNRVLVDDIFAKIASLNLPNDLAMAVGLIVSATQTESNKDLLAATKILQEHTWARNPKRK